MWHETPAHSCPVELCITQTPVPMTVEGEGGQFEPLYVHVHVDYNTAELIGIP